MDGPLRDGYDAIVGAIGALLGALAIIGGGMVMWNAVLSTQAEVKRLHEAIARLEERNALLLELVTAGVDSLLMQAKLHTTILEAKEPRRIRGDG